MYYRFIEIIPGEEGEDYPIMQKVGNSEFRLTKDIDANIVVREDSIDDALDEDAISSIDFTGIKNQITIMKGLSAASPLPWYALFVLSFLGITINPLYNIVLTALYVESGFNEYSREECDRMYLNTVLAPIGSTILKYILTGLLMVVIGNNYKWDNTTDRTSVATMQPIW